MLLRLFLIYLLFAGFQLGYAQDINPGYGANTLDLTGEWRFRADPDDKGIEKRWFETELTQRVQLPGSMTTNNKGDEVGVHTPWTGTIVDSSWFFAPEYAAYRQPENIKVPFWLQPVKYYKGAAWYQKTITIPTLWSSSHIELFIERSHWETTVWVDGNLVGTSNSLGTPHRYQLSEQLRPGTHLLTVRVDNRIRDINVGPNSHSISDHTQTNWNGMIGRLALISSPRLRIEGVQLYPDVQSKLVKAVIKIDNPQNGKIEARIELKASTTGSSAQKLPSVTRKVTVKGGGTVVELLYPMGREPLLWDEFHPHLYTMQVNLTSGKIRDEKELTFGMREFLAKGTQFTVNGNPRFLRGTLECAVFPKTGYPPTEVEAWVHIFKVCRSYGLNHMRFHSWTPPEAAFTAADRLGFYLQVEVGSWANQGATIGDGQPLDSYIYAESERIINAYGNHPSFCMMAYGNEPAGDHQVEYLSKFVSYWKKKDPRRLYTSAGGWPIIPENDYNNSPDPRIQGWGQGLKSIINAQRPHTDYDWSKIIAKWQRPTVSHEIGQWCVYPNFKEIPKYDGVLKARNFEIFQEKLNKNKMGALADSFLLASGKLQVLCYKADIEAALRTPGFAGFQLLDLHDFPGQGTALVGVLDAFWDDKGYVTGDQYSQFCNATVPLARLPKMVYLNNEELAVNIEVAHFGESALQHVRPEWRITNASGKTLFSGQLPETDVPLGNGFKLGEIRQALATVKQAEMLTLTITIQGNYNSWHIFVYPATLPPVEGITVTGQLDDSAMKVLASGGKVLLTAKKGSVKPEAGADIRIGFSSIFWNTAWTGGQPPTTLGILCDPGHPAFKNFPTEYYSNWQWWDAMTHSSAIRLDKVAPGIMPLVRVIDDWVTAQPLGLIFECRVGKGRLMVSGIDLLTGMDKRPEARQLLYSLKAYMAGEKFDPTLQVTPESVRGLLK